MQHLSLLATNKDELLWPSLLLGKGGQLRITGELYHTCFAHPGVRIRSLLRSVGGS